LKGWGTAGLPTGNVPRLEYGSHPRIRATNLEMTFIVVLQLSRKGVLYEA